MAGHSQFKNIMHRKGRQDAVMVEDVSKLARGDHRRGQAGHCRPDDEPAPAPGDPERQGGVHAEGQHPARHQQGYRRRGRQLRGGALRGLRPRRRGADRGGADRQPQPLRLQCARRLHQGRRGAGRDGLGLLHVGPRRRDRLSGRGRQRRHGDGRRDRGWRRRCRVTTRTPHIYCAFEALGDVSKALEGALGEATSVKAIWSRQNTCRWTRSAPSR